MSLLALSLSFLLLNPVLAPQGGAGKSTLIALEQQWLEASDGVEGNWFGASVGLSGEWLAVGAREDATFGSFSGAAYVYHWNGAAWLETQKVLASDGSYDQDFGRSLALQGDTLVVGAPHFNLPGSAVYVFARSGTSWIETQKIPPPGGHIPYFGYSVALDGDRFVVGAPEMSTGTNGRAFVYVRAGSSWVQEAELYSGDTAYGRSVAIQGDTAVVGQPHEMVGGSDNAHVFTRSGSTWTHQAVLTASDAGADDEFGHAVAIHGSTIAVGAWYDSDQGFRSGSAYVFTGGGATWVQRAKLLPPAEIAPFRKFGSSITVQGDVVLVGAEGTTDLGESSGAAWLFRSGASGWAVESKVLPFEGAKGDRFGYAVDLDGSRASIGAIEHANAVNRSGSAYVFTLAESTCPPAVKYGGGVDGANAALLDCSSAPVPGSSATFMLSNFGPSGAALLAITPDIGYLPIFGGAFVVELGGPWIAMGVPLTAGRAVLVLNLPPVPGLSFALQAGAPDPAQTQGIVLSNGLWLATCP